MPQRQIQQMILRVYKNNNQLYFEGYTKNVLCWCVEGEKAQFYMVSKSELKSMVENAWKYGLYVGEIEYDYLPSNADICKKNTCL